MSATASRLGGWVGLGLALVLGLSACNGRDAGDVASDLDGVVGPAMTERLLRDVDLALSPVAVRAGSHEEERFGAVDQPRLEQVLRDAERALDGDRVRVTQRVVEEADSTTPTLTVTLALEHQGRTQYVPVRLGLLREGRRVLVTSVRVMSDVRGLEPVVEASAGGGP